MAHDVNISSEISVERYFNIVTAGDRAEMLCCLIDTLNKYYNHSNWKVVFVFQGYSQDTIADLVKRCVLPSIVISFDERIGMFNARQEGIKKVLEISSGEFLTVFLDDDMELLSSTNYGILEPVALLPNVGMVSGNWVPHMSMISKRKLQDKLIKQPIVYTGGGMMFSRKIAELISNLESGNYYSDNTEVSMRVYISGYDNFRHLGTLALHKICRKGGRKAWVNFGQQKIKSDSRLITMRDGKAKDNVNASNDSKILIGASSDLTELAHRLHKQNAKLL